MALILGNGILYLTNSFGILGLVPTFIVGLIGDFILLNKNSKFLKTSIISILRKIVKK